MNEVTNKAGEIVDFSYDDDVAALFLETVTDKVARSILFDTFVDEDADADSFDLGVYEIIKIMKRIVNAAFVIALTRWKQLDEESKDPKKWKGQAVGYFENSRFTKIFQSAIGNEEITIDLQIFALIELWVSLRDAPSLVRDKFAMIFDTGFSGEGDMIGLTLQSARDAIKNTSFKSSGRGGYTKAELNRLCYDLLYAFLIFRVAKFTYPEDNRLDDPKDFSVEYLLFGQQVTLYPNICFENCKIIVSYQQLQALQGNKDIGAVANLSLYLLSSVSTFGDRLQVTYHSFDGDSETRTSFEIKRENQQKPASDFSDLIEMRKFLSFSYKNIRELAIVISDAIKDNPTKKQELYSICKEKHVKIIADIPGYDAPNIYWDNIITLMLVEIGFSDFLELILKDEQLFFDIMDNIGLRYIGTEESSDYTDTYNKNAEELSAQCKNNTTAFDESCLDLRVRTVLKAMRFDKEESLKMSPFEESLSFKYENIRLCLDVLGRKDAVYGELNANRENLIDIFKNIFAFLQIFYVGLDSYADKKISLIKTTPVPENETDEEMRQRIGSRRRECRKEFVAKAQEQYDKIKNQSLSEIFEGFCKMCEEYNSSANNGSYSVSKKAKNLKYLITRNYICDVEKLRYFSSITLQDGTPSTIFKMIEIFSPQYCLDEKYTEWLTYFYDIFFFLIYNDDYSERGMWDEKKLKENGWTLKDKDCDPIYPYIVTYYKENVDRDNLKKCTYRVPMPTSVSDESKQGFVVTLLTEENYPPNTYFCIPLRYGSSDNWWINPFLIPKLVVRNLKLDDKNESHHN